MQVRACFLTQHIAHAAMPYIPRIAVQIGAAAVPPIALLAAVHGIALAVRAGASRGVYCWAVSAVAAIGAGVFAVSFLALRDLMQVIGYSSATAWMFPAIIDTAVAVSTLMLVALGDKPARRTRAVGTQIASAQRVLEGAKCTLQNTCTETSGTAVCGPKPHAIYARRGANLCTVCTKLGCIGARIGTYNSARR
jgi:Protein of unknown function (DUF2637)